jgi:hypothetical protein
VDKPTESPSKKVESKKTQELKEGEKVVKFTVELREEGNNPADNPADKKEGYEN